MTWWPCLYCERADDPDGCDNCQGCGARRDPVITVTIWAGYPVMGPMEFTKPRARPRPYLHQWAPPSDGQDMTLDKLNEAIEAIIRRINEDQ